MSARVCECCGQPLPTNNAQIALSLGLSRSQSVVFVALANANGRMVTHEGLINELWGLDPDGGPDAPMAVVRAHVMRIKPKAAAIGLNLVCVWGQGYRIERRNDHQRSQAAA